MNVRSHSLVRWIRSGFIAFAAFACASMAHAQYGYGDGQPGNRIYVATGASVAVIDSFTNAVLGTISVGGSPGTIVSTPDGSRVFVTVPSIDRVAILDPATFSQTASVPVGDAPSAAALAPSGDQLFILTTGGVVQVLDTVTRNVIRSIPTAGGSTGGMAVTADGTRLYVAHGPITVIDTSASDSLGSFSSGYSGIEVSPDGSRVYASTGFMGTVQAISTASMTVVGTISIAGGPSAMDISPDGSRLYVAHAAAFVMTSQYTGQIVPGRFISVVDTRTNTVGARIDLGGNSTGVAVVVTPDRRRVYASVAAAVAVADVNTNLVVGSVPVSTPGALAASGDTAIIPYVIDAVDDIAPNSLSTGIAVANVLANDTLGGIRPTTQHVTLTEQSSSDPYVTLNTTTGAVTVAAGAALGSHTLQYQICEIGSSSNCDSALVSLTVRAPYPIDAVDDLASTLPNRTAVANVLVNDTLNSAPATVANVKLFQMSTTAPTISLNASTGAVFVASGTPAGTHTLLYQICELPSLGNCDQAAVTLTVSAFPIDAVDDTGTTTRSGGTAVANVLLNDRFAGGAASTSTVVLSQISASAGLSLSASGAVTVAYGTAVGTATLVYQICEKASLTNCDRATVSVSVTKFVIDAVNDATRAYSKPPSPIVILPNVLANDWLGTQRPTTATVSLTKVSSTSPNIVLNTSTGAVSLLKKTESGYHSLVYRICEIGDSTNCDQATVVIDLSGSSN